MSMGEMVLKVDSPRFTHLVVWRIRGRRAVNGSVCGETRTRGLGAGIIQHRMGTWERYKAVCTVKEV